MSVRIAAVMVVTAVTGERLTGADTQPALVAITRAASVRIKHADGQCHVGRDLNLDGTIRLNRDITDNLAHQLLTAAAIGRCREIQCFVIGDADCLDDAQETRRTLIRQRLCGMEGWLALSFPILSKMPLVIL